MTDKQTVIDFQVTGTIRISRDGILTKEDADKERDYIECALYKAADHAAANFNVFPMFTLGSLEELTIEDV